jgi:Glyoxalase-like domain
VSAAPVRPAYGFLGMPRTAQPPTSPSSGQAASEAMERVIVLPARSNSAAVTQAAANRLELIGSLPVRCWVMASLIKAVTFDCSDAIALATFWAAALGTDVDEDATSDHAFVEAPGWGGPNMLFIRVPEPKTAKNRMHFDLRAPVTMADEVNRLEALGATVVERFAGLTRMDDPEGNAFCVELGPADS